MAKAAKPAAKPAKPKASKGSKFDFQGFLLQRGERVGLITAGALALILVAYALFWPGSGLLAPSSTEMAEALTKPSERIEVQIRDPNNLPTDADKPPKDSERIELTGELVKGADFRITGLLSETDSVQLGRRQPRVLTAEEATGAVARLQMRGYLIKQGNPPTVYVLEGGEDKGDGNKGGPARPGSGKGGGPPPGMGGPPPGMGGFAGGNKGGKSGNPLLDYFTKRKNKAKDRDLFAPPSDLFKNSGGPKLKPKPMDKADNNDRLALQTVPVRMAILAAAFPYKKQVEEFRQRLGLKTTEEVLTEGSMERDRDGNPQFAFRFLGVLVERRELDADGNPVEGKDGQWKQLDLSEDYKPYVVAAGRYFQPEDPTLLAISFPGLVMPRLPEIGRDKESGGEGDGMGGKGGPPGMGGKGGPPPAPGSGKGGPPPMPGSKGGPPPMPGSKGGPPPMPGGKDDPAAKETPEQETQYPPIEKSLEKLKKTLEALKDKDEDVAPPSSKFSAGQFDAFSAGRKTAESSDKDKMMPVMPGGKGMTTPQDPGKEKELPEYCLIRVIDVDVHPGHNYEYRLKVRMANPNYKRRDTASPAYGTKLELEAGEWSDKKIVVRVEPELRFYAVNQAEAEKLGNSSAKYSDRYSRDSNLRSDRVLFFQAHRWLDFARRAGDRPTDQLPIGEWAVAERFPVYRGEYVGRSERVEVPYWLPNLENFTIATDSTTTKNEPGLSIPFGYNAGGAQPEAILVDFDGGAVAYNRVIGRKGDKVETKRLPDVSAGEALMMTPDGSLLLRETADDVADESRQKRLKEFKLRVREVKDVGKPPEEREQKDKEKDKKKKPFGD